MERVSHRQAEELGPAAPVISGHGIAGIVAVRAQRDPSHLEARLLGGRLERSRGRRWSRSRRGCGASSGGAVRDGEPLEHGPHISVECVRDHRRSPSSDVSHEPGCKAKAPAPGAGASEKTLVGELTHAKTPGRHGGIHPQACRLVAGRGGLQSHWALASHGFVAWSAYLTTVRFFPQGRRAFRGRPGERAGECGAHAV
jgi:hypothetical protein